MKIPGFRQNFQTNTKKLKKEKNVFVYTAKCLTAKKIMVFFFIYIYIYIK